MKKIACWGNEFISPAFVLAFNAQKPSNSASYWFSIAVFRMRKSGGVIKDLRGKELNKTPCIIHDKY